MLNIPIVVYKCSDKFVACATLSFPAEGVVLHGTGCTEAQAVDGLRKKVVVALSAHGVLDMWARQLEDSPHIKVPADFMQPIGGQTPWAIEASDSYQRQERLVACLMALEPLAAIADAYDKNGLDEARPEWVSAGNETFDPDKELYCGRGGAALLTLRHAFTAREVLRATAAGRLLPVTFREQKTALNSIRAIACSTQSPQQQIKEIREVLENLEK